MMEQRSQPGRGPSQPDDRRNYDAGGAFAQIGSVLVNGFPFAARFKKSLRVGSGAATLAAFDGGDGWVLADGALAAFVGRDRANSGKYFIWFENGTIRLQSQQGGDLWLIDPLTGQIAQPTWIAAPTLLNLYTANVAVEYRKNLPTNEAVWAGSVNMAAGSVNQVMFNIPAGFRPKNTGTSPAYFPVPVLTGGAWSSALALIAANGDLSIFAPAGTTLAGLDGLRYPTT